MSERLTADISHDLRASAQDMRAEHRNTDAGLLTEAADKLDGLIALLAEAETERDEARAQDCGHDLERIERHERELRAKSGDLVNIRGLLSPNGYPRVVPMDLGATVAPAVEWLIDERDRLAETTEETLRRLCVLAGYESDAYDEGEQGLGPKVTMADALDDIQERISLLQGALKLADQNWRTRKAENEHLAAELAEIRAALTDGLTDFERHLLTEPAAIAGYIRAWRAASKAKIEAYSRLAHTVRRVRALADRAAGYDFAIVPEQIYAALDAHLPEVGEPGSNLGADDPIETGTEAALGEARRKIAEVRAIHQQYRTAWVDWDTCAGCNQGMELVRWPCPTIRALDASPGDAPARQRDEGEA